ncbi:MAG: sulfatase [Bacteroidia bacterium]
MSINFVHYSILKNKPRAQKLICSCFVTLCCFSLIIGLLNIRIIDMLGKPFNYQWLYYSNFLKGADAQAAISANINSSYIFRLLSICISAIVIGMIALKAFSFLWYNISWRKTTIVLLLLTIIGYSITAQKKLQAHQWNYGRLANPITAFVASVNPFAENPDLFTMQVSDSLIFRKENVPPNNLSVLPNNKIKNIIVFVLESTPAEYIQTYGSKYPVSPTIKKYEKQSITFENIYAHAPATNMSMVSLINSIYPWLSYNSLTQEHPDLKTPSISTELQQRGYRTAFFNSADNRYQKADEYLLNRKFERISDCNYNSCGTQKFEYTDEKKNFLNGKDDACTGKEIIEWIKQDTSQPFLGIMWTYQTHYPYFFNGPEIVYEANNALFNRYLNALQHGDSVLGKLLEDLERLHLSESTLVVVVGDHGEAFGRHNQTTHGREIYEENMHIPCVLINPAFQGERKKEIGGMVDISPTIMNVLGFESPAEWHGTSLLSKTPESRAYFFAPWSDYLFGFREADYKYIYNATLNETEVYDLQNDPYEERNLVNEKMSSINIAHQRLASWTQYVNSETEKILKQ